jgi:tRNA dimethylallyltransferase
LLDFLLPIFYGFHTLQGQIIMSEFRQMALIGSTASGKSALAIELAHKNNAHILSLDSLAIYKEINIVSAKPCMEERENIQHFGLDVIFPDQPFDVTTFIKLYHQAKKTSIKDGKNLIIVGGTSFYLNILLNGISQLPTISEQSRLKSHKLLSNLEKAYRFLYTLDQAYMKSIAPSDRYRIEKMLNLYFETNLTPSEYFKKNPPKPTITQKLPIYEIAVEKEILRQRINTRTLKMLKCGLIDEIFYLEKHYSRQPNCMKAIGIKEVLSYLDGEYTKTEMQEQIVIHTTQLAKRQRTFNKSQFQNKTMLPLYELSKLLAKKDVFI